MFLRATLAVIVVPLAISSAIAREDAKTEEVDCTAGRSISQALTTEKDAQPLILVVRGTCTESVRIDRDDVTVRGDATGGTIHGPDPSVNTVNVTGRRVTLERLTVSGGRNGITASGATEFTVRGATVQSGRNGIVYVSGSSGTVDDCMIQSNGRDGVSVDTASVTIINSTISRNARFGVLVAIGGAARIGVDIRNAAGGNTISQNANSGIVVSGGGTAMIAANEITGNGGQGVSVTESRVDMPGGNTISGNATQGVFARASTVQIGGPALGFSTINTITGNASAASPFGGVFALLGSSMVVRDAVIDGNFGFGLGFSLRSQGQIFGSTIQNNSGDGIRLVLGSALLPSTPTSTVSRNTGFGVQCFDGESSVVNTTLPFLSVSANAAGDVSAGCTPF